MADPSAARSPATAWVLPDEPVPVRLMNTIWADRRGVHDALGDRVDLGRWLSATGLATGPVPATEADLVHFRSLRDALRRLAALITSDPRPAAASAVQDLDVAVAEVNAAAAASPAVPRLQVLDGALHRTRTRPDRDVDAALSAVTAEAIDLLTGPTAAGLRACHSPGCVLYFLKDHPRRDWCSTGCGNRVRAARYYRRHREGAS